MSFTEVALDALIESAPLERAGGRDMPILSMTMHEGLVDQASKFKKRVASTDTADYKLVHRNQLVVGFPIDEGVLSFQDLYDAAIVSPAYDIWNLRRTHEIEPTYLERFLRSPRALAFYRTKLRGTTARRRTLPDDIFLNLPVPLPSPTEQRRIAAILDKADELRAKRRAALAKLDSLIQSIFLDMFGKSEVPIKTIGQLLDCGALLLHKDGNHGSLYPRADDFGNEGVPFLSAKTVSEEGEIDNELLEYLLEEKANRLKIGWILKGDVLLAHNASVGKVALYDGRFERALIGTSLTAFRPNPEILHSNYLATALRARTFQQQLEKNMGQTTRNQVPITAQRDLKIGLPCIRLQREFARKTIAVEALRTTHRGSVANLELLFLSLQHRAFQGEL